MAPLSSVTVAGRSPAHVKVRRSPVSTNSISWSLYSGIEVEPRARAQRVGVMGLVDVVRPGRGEVEAMDGVAFADLRHREDAPAGLVGVLDALSLGVGDRGEHPQQAVFVTGARPALRDLEGALRDGEVAEAVPGVLGPPAAADVGDADRPLARVEGDRIERGAGDRGRALRELERRRAPGVADPRVVERRPVHRCQAPARVEVVGQAALGLHRIGIDLDPVGAGDRAAGRETVRVEAAARGVRERDTVPAHREAEGPAPEARVVDRADRAGSRPPGCRA